MTGSPIHDFLCLLLMDVIILVNVLNHLPENHTLAAAADPLLRTGLGSGRIYNTIQGSAGVNPLRERTLDCLLH